MGKLDRIAQGMLRPINPYSPLILGIGTACWGLWVLSPFWDVFSHAALFSRMDGLAPEWAWGLWAFLAGSLLIFSIVKGYFTCLAKTLKFIGWHWFTVAVMMWWGDWNNTGGLTYSFITLYVCYLYLNIKCNYVKHIHKQPHF